MRTRLLLFLAPVLLVMHLLLNLVPSMKGMWSELYFYNAIALTAIAVVMNAPRVNDRFAQPLIAAAFGLWLSGSLISSISSYFLVSAPTQLLSNIAYLLFYPLAIVALPRLLSPSRKFSTLEIFDASIVGLGLTTLGTTFFLKPVLPHFNGDLVQTFFAIIYPIADLIVISLTLATTLAQGPSKRGLVLATGVLTFSITDFFYLGMHINNTYTFGSLIDDGWLLGLLIIALSFHCTGSDSLDDKSTNPILITLSVFLSATLLALIALRPGYFPNFVLIPAIATLLLAFIRMTIALKAAKNIGHERILARTDELTGLPNRRTLISEIESFMGKDGSLMLLDLDGFKPVNDSHGHAAGDKVLQQVALRFSRALPHGALLARLGGDEFGVLYEGSYESAMDLALALRATLSYPFTIENHHIQIGVSIGLAANNGAPDLLRRADDAMYRAKREGLGVCRL
jgi:diguanylate cyclase (GGDEF)-like protein